MGNALILPSHCDGFNLQVSLDFLVKYLDYSVFNEAWVVHETEEEITNTRDLLASLNDRRFKVIKNSGTGIMGCINEVLCISSADNFVVIPGDDFPIVFSVRDFFDLLQTGCAFVSGTRYAHGGVRIGGNFIGNVLSSLCSRLIGQFSGRGYTDLTTGVKGFRRSYFDSLSLSVRPDAGWEYGFQMCLSSESIDQAVGEVAIRSVDRIFGGRSSFKLLRSIRKYTRVAISYSYSSFLINQKASSAAIVRKIYFES